VVCDHGMVYLSQAFQAACRAMGVNFQPTHEGSPWEKGAVERTFASIASLFAQYVAGYTGRSVDRRGKNAGQDAAWSLAELQDLLDEWIVAHWQNRPHDGLRHPLTPGAALTPNEQYAALLEVAGYVPAPLAAGDYLELLPATWRVINAYGIKISRRTYDCQALNPYRGQASGIAAHKGRWEVHYDPYDVTRIWVRNHHDSGWITVPWTHLRTAPAPFGEAAWARAAAPTRPPSPRSPAPWRPCWSGPEQARRNPGRASATGESRRAPAPRLLRAGRGPPTTVNPGPLPARASRSRTSSPR